MNVKRCIVLFAVGMFFLLQPSYAQINSLSLQNLASVNIDDVPDDQIQAYLKKATENGISEQGIYRLLSEKGLPAGELVKLKVRLQNLNNQPKNNSNNGEEIPERSKNDKDRYANKDASNVPMQKKQQDISVFGSELFTTNSLVFEPNLRIPTPSGYIVGPDDELIVNVFGLSEKSYTLTVNEEGNIYIPQVGPVFVNGLSIDQAASKIKAKLASTIYRAIGSGRTRVQISLGKIRSIRVTVIGEATKPGTYTISSLTTVFNLLYLCGGPSDYGSYRKIELIRGNELARTVDLYGFLLKGNQKDNVLLREGDVIRIPYFDTQITLNGSVRHKGKYELLPGESLSNAFQFCGGFTEDAYKASVTVYQYTDRERRIIDLEKNNFTTYIPQPGDSVVAGMLLNRFENKLVIRGAVMRPGEYEFSNNITLQQLIEKAGGIREDAYNQRGSISRYNDKNIPQQVSFAIDSVMKGLTTIALKKNDSIAVYSISELRNELTISIDGNVKRPGKYIWADNLTLRDVLLRSGGLNELGDSRNIEIARKINNLSLTQLNYQQTEIITVNVSDSATIDVILQPFDVINVRQKPDYNSQRNVFVEGMVINPGRYTLRTSNDRISDVIKRAGGFRANADTTALVIKRFSKHSETAEEREKVFSKLLNIKSDSLNTAERIKNEISKDYDKISIDLTKALQDNDENENMLLEDGDILAIEQNSSLVKVSGEVYYPTIIPFKKGANLKYYIHKSGSFTELARKSGMLVIYPDGKAKQVKRFLFFKIYPEVVSRSEIFVPQKSDKNKTRVTASEWAVILSSLGIIANVIVNLSK